MNYFVTGTDTGIGKTLVACALLHGFAARGKLAAGMKPVAAGVDADGQNEDVRMLLAASNVAAGDGLVNPYCFPQAIAPHIAARLTGGEIEFARIAEAYKKLAVLADVVVVEGAGGLLVPLNERQNGADLAAELQLAVVMVVGMRLGCLNHALLTAEAIAARGLTLSGWVANVIEGTTRRCTKSRQSTIQQAECGIVTEASGAGVPSGRILSQTSGDPCGELNAATDMPALQENIAALQRRIGAPLLGVVPHLPRADARVAAGYLHLERLGS